MRLLAILILLTGALPAQVTHYQIRFVSADPSGSCAPSYITINRTTGAMYGCVGGTWTAIGGSGSPTGSAGGDLAGTYPNPTLANKNQVLGPVIYEADGSITLSGSAVIDMDSGHLGNGNLTLLEQVPATPNSSTQTLYYDPTTHHLTRINSSAVVTDLEAPCSTCEVTTRKNQANGYLGLDAFGAANLANPGVFYVAPPGGAPTEGSTLGSDGLHTPRITLGTSAVAGTIDTYEGVPAFVPSASTQALFLDPTTHHLQRKNNSSVIVDLETPTAANVILGFSGTCNSSSAMMGDGSCAAISSAYTAITGLSLGDTLYGSGSATAKLAGSTSATKQFYTQTGNGSASAAPAWGTLASGDLSGTYSLGTGYLSGTKTAGSGGVTANLLVKIDSTGNVVLPATSDVGILGVAVTTASAAANVEVATRGIINCVADNTTIIGDVAIVGTLTAGRCRDSGQTSTTSIALTTQIIGKFLSVVSAGSNASVQLYGPGHYGTQFPALSSDLSNTAGSTAVTVASIGGKTVTLANSFTTSGNNPLTITTTGTTNITVPTSGTMAILGANTFTGTQTMPGTMSISDGTGFSVLNVPTNGALELNLPNNSTFFRDHFSQWAITPADFNAYQSFIFKWSSAGAYNSGSKDIGVDRDGAGILGVTNGTQGTTAANYRDLKLRHYLGAGTAPAVASGFGSSPSIAGADAGGRVTIGTGGVATTGAITFGTAYATAPACTVNDETSVLLIQATATTTTLTLSAATPFGAADKLTWACIGY